MCEIARYAFAVSRLVRGWERSGGGACTVQLVVVPDSVRSVFDESVEFEPCGAVCGLGANLERKQLRFHMARPWRAARRCWMTMGAAAAMMTAATC